MDNARLEDITQQLRAEEQRLGQQAGELHRQLAEVELDLQKVHGALKQLGEKPAKAAKPVGGRGVPKKPAATKDDVLSTIADIQSGSSQIEAGELRAEVERRIVAAGKSRNGLSLRYKEAMKELNSEQHVAGIGK